MTGPREPLPRTTVSDMNEPTPGRARPLSTCSKCPESRARAQVVRLVAYTGLIDLRRQEFIYKVKSAKGLRAGDFPRHNHCLGGAREHCEPSWVACAWLREVLLLLRPRAGPRLEGLPALLILRQSLIATYLFAFPGSRPSGEALRFLRAVLLGAGRRLALSLGLELFADQTLQAAEGGPEGGKHVGCAEAVAGGVVAGVDRVHDYKLLGVHLRKRKE